MKSFGKIFFLLTILTLKICVAQNVQIANGWYYIDGKKFFVKGIGYETHTRPGQAPWIYKFDADLIRFDLDRIKNAGFNTIRTWGAITEEELKLVEESGLKILFGIWIDPAGDFGSQSFRTSALNQVNAVLNYSNKYKSIIGYLIMNEPQVAHIYNAGAQNLLSLWQAVKDLIHQRHVGVPVSFSNTIVGDYISTDIFDFTAYNAYIYNPVTISGSHGYAGYLSFLKNNRASQKPFIVTEYGLSVSPGTPGTQYTYGGNTLAQQTSGNLLMYRSLIDAGAQGGVVFQYHDGWWKGGNEFVHDSTPEEWFGLIEFANQNDKFGSPRPVWSAYTTYNKAIITEPKNEKIYGEQIPIEIFTTEDVRSFTIVMNDSTVLTQNVSSNYFSGNLSLKLIEQVKDLELTFHFFDASGVELKSEAISVLCSKKQLQLPEIKMQIVPASLNPGSKNYVLVDITNDSLFTIEGNKVDYVVHPHIGFDEGTAKSKVITLLDNNYPFTDNFDIPKETKAATFGAGFTIEHGKFSKRIFTQLILTHGTWANPIKAPDVITHVDDFKSRTGESIPGIKLFQNSPNPFNPETTISYKIQAGSRVSLKVYDILGREVATLVNEFKQPGNYKVTLSARHFERSREITSGVYFYTLKAGSHVESKKMLLLK